MNNKIQDKLIEVTAFILVISVMLYFWKITLVFLSIMFIFELIILSIIFAKYYYYHHNKQFLNSIS
jgi:hypothetical protein